MSLSSSQPQQQPQPARLTRLNLLILEMDGYERSIHEYETQIKELERQLAAEVESEALRNDSSESPSADNGLREGCGEGHAGGVADDDTITISHLAAPGGNNNNRT